METIAVLVVPLQRQVVIDQRGRSPGRVVDR
jgi:hypothetical protein